MEYTKIVKLAKQYGDESILEDVDELLDVIQLEDEIGIDLE